jgi:hypothetical protein
MTLIIPHIRNITYPSLKRHDGSRNYYLYDDQDFILYEDIDILIEYGYIDENYLTDLSDYEVRNYPFNFTASELNLTEINVNITR